MITYHNRTHMTAVPTRLLLDTNLSAEAKLTGALLYTFEDGGLSAQELADVLTLPPEKVAPVFAELTGNGYLDNSGRKRCLRAAPEGVILMPDRTRPIRKEICLNEQELNLIQHKMRQLGTHNFGAYARKMLIDGYIIKVDYTEQKKLAAAVSRAASNVNQICRRINSTGHCYEDDVAELKARQAEIWELLKARQKDEL